MLRGVVNDGFPKLNSAVWSSAVLILTLAPIPIPDDFPLQGIETAIRITKNHTDLRVYLRKHKRVAKAYVLRSVRTRAGQEPPESLIVGQ
jgi:hypothetical protein